MPFAPGTSATFGFARFALVPCSQPRLFFDSQPMQEDSLIPELRQATDSLGLNAYRRHIFLCADQTDPKCAPKQQTLEAWDFLKRRLKELNLVGPEPLVFRTKANCLRVCVRGPI